MMTMTTSTATTASPWRPPPITTTAITSQPLQESRVSKSGILDTDLERTLLLPVLREIPTGISSHPPSAAVDEFFIDGNDRTLPQPCLYPSPTLEERSPTLQLSISSAVVNEPFEYRSQLVELTALFDRLKQRQTPPPPIDPSHPTIPSNTLDPHPDPPSCSVDDDSFDDTPKLTASTTAIAPMMHHLLPFVIQLLQQQPKPL